MDISIVIPAFNEEKRLLSSLPSIANYLKQEFNGDFEIIVVDDGSRDKTGEVVSNFARKEKDVHLIKNSVNRGKGYSVKRGMLKASGTYILFSDADLSTPIQEVKKLLTAMTENGYDIVIASRGLSGAIIELHQAWYRETMGKLFNKLVRILTGLKYKDTQCGFKLFRGDVVKDLFHLQTIDRFSFDVEILYIAKKLKLKVFEIPVRWINSPQSRVGIFRDSARMLKELFKIRYNELRGRYNIR